MLNRHSHRSFCAALVLSDRKYPFYSFLEFDCLYSGTSKMSSDGNCVADWRHVTGSYYKYEPSVAAAAIFSALFGLSLLGHVFQMIRARALFLTALVVGCLFELIGFVARTISATEKAGCWSYSPYVIQTLFILLAPALFAASVYMTLGRIIELVDGEKYAIIKRKWLTKIFVLGDIICFFLLAAGGGTLASAKSDKSKLDAGNNIIIGGLVLQILWFGFFVVVALIFHRRMILAPTARSHESNINWRSYLYALYVASSLIIIRNIFRLIEYVQGQSGYLLTTEVFVYCLDALPMFLVVLWFHWQYPGELSALLRKQALYNSNSMQEIRMS
ncbi:RTA1 like domain-containing protein [Trichoderma chlorosporum]